MEKRGILLLCDPLRGGSRFSQMHSNTKALVFSQDGRFFSQAQTALCRRRRECGWICVAASGAAVGIALALAAQLMVDRLALWPEPALPSRPRELLRIEGFARRNLSLIASEILLVEPPQELLRGLAGGLSRSCELRCTDAAALEWSQLSVPWHGEAH